MIRNGTARAVTLIVTDYTRRIGGEPLPVQWMGESRPLDLEESAGRRKVPLGPANGNLPYDETRHQNEEGESHDQDSAAADEALKPLLHGSADRITANHASRVEKVIGTAKTDGERSDGRGSWDECQGGPTGGQASFRRPSPYACQGRDR